MLAVILKILSILGIILLILIGLVLVVLLLVLFMPIVYKIDAAKNDTEMRANIKIRWLFGFLRARFDYPEPGNFIVKVLWKTVFDSDKKTERQKETVDGNSTPDSVDKMSDKQQLNENSTAADSIGSDETEDKEDSNTRDGRPVSEETVPPNDGVEETAESEHKTFSEKLFAKYEKIKYTIQEFYVKIKHIWDNFSFYKKLLQDEQTKLLISHVFSRLGKLISHIRPKKLKADVTFGTGEPDTTGYSYGVYCILSPKLGKSVLVTPDFEQKILVGNVYAAGHITVFTILVNILAVLLDKRLRILIRRLKNHSTRQNKQKCTFPNDKAEA